MKKYSFYILPFVVFPVIFLVLNWLDSIDVLQSAQMIIITSVLCTLFSCLMGGLSRSDKKFDYIMTALIPFSLFFAVFISLLFDEGCDGMAQFSIHHALNIEYYLTWLPAVIIMTILTFGSSFKPIRISGKLQSK